MAFKGGTTSGVVAAFEDAKKYDYFAMRLAEHKGEKGEAALPFMHTSSKSRVIVQWQTEETPPDAVNTKMKKAIDAL